MMRSGTLRVGVVQLALEDELHANRDKIVRFIHEAATQGCRLVVFPEGALHSPPETPAAQIEEAARALRDAARAAGIYVVTGLQHKRADDPSTSSGQAAPQHQRLLAIAPDGSLLQTYDKIWGDRLANEVPGTFQIDGVTCGAAICADRWARGIDELPAFDGAQLLIECSCNWLREWVADLDHFWCVPRARRTGAYVLFSNTAHYHGQKPRHGHTAIFAPDGRRLAYAGDDPDRLIVSTLDFSQATLAPTEERRTHPLFRRFWEIGVTLMNGGQVDVPDEVLAHAPLISPEVELKVAAAQMACSRSLDENVTRAAALIREAAAELADVVVFPELALTGAREADVRAADAAAIQAAVDAIRSAAREAAIAVVIGTPWVEGTERFNCAIAIGPDGEVLTRYAQIAIDRPELFTAGASTRAMWCEIKGVPTVITVGRDAQWSELAELAAARGAQVHLHLAYDRDVSPGASRRRRQVWTNLANYRTLTVLVNAADPSHLSQPSAPSQGGSAIWDDYRREPHMTARRAGHGPWSAYRVAEASEAEETLYARQVVPPVNGHWQQMTHTVYSQMLPWYAVGVQAIFSDLATPARAAQLTPELAGANA